MEALKNFEANQIFRLVKTKKSTTISHGVGRRIYPWNFFNCLLKTIIADATAIRVHVANK